MDPYRQVAIGLVVATALGTMPKHASGGVVSTRQAMEFSQATLACKLKMGPITAQELPVLGTKCDATCHVISWLKGDLGKEVKITFRQHGSGFVEPGVDAIKAGEVYVVMLRGASEPYEVFAATKAVEAAVEPRFGTGPGDRLMAELVAMCKSNDPQMRIDAIEQIGAMRDRRGTREVNEAADSEDPEMSRAGMIAQYRMRIAPDAKRLMKLFNEQVMDVWYQESGIPQKDSNGNWVSRREGGISFVERGVPDFDYATYVREGIKNDWVRKDDHSLYVFFGVPWKVQRKACVPELVKLLDDPNPKVRWWAVLCLTHTVENTDRPRWEEYQEQERQELAKWRTWWADKGQAFMAIPATQPRSPETQRAPVRPVTAR